MENSVMVLRPYRIGVLIPSGLFNADAMPKISLQYSYMVHAAAFYRSCSTVSFEFSAATCAFPAAPDLRFLSTFSMNASPAL